MSTKMLVTMKLDQRLAMSQQLRQAITLLQYNTLELKQIVQQHIESNPLIDIDEIESVESSEFSNQTEDYSTQYYSANLARKHIYQSEDDTLENYSKHKSLRDHLLEQTLLCRFDAMQQTIAEFIIDAIDEDGFLTMSLEEIQQSIAKQITVTLQQLQDVLKKIQSFDPSGVGSRNIRECLLIQLDAFSDKNNAWALAYKIIDELSFDFQITNAKQMMKHLKASHKEYAEAMDLIRTLNFHPGSQYLTDKYNYLEPELYVKKISGSWRVFLAESILTHVKINKQYQELIKKEKRHEAYASLKQELEEARWLVNGLKKRNETLFNVATHIVKMQNDFLEHGHEFMKPMNIIDVSDALGLHESTVSRITTGKYIATPRGVFELKYFFPSHVTTQTGDMCSAVAVKAFIKDIISQETANHIYSDSEIADILQKKGINIARRTVAKYRESMNLLSSYQRQVQYGASSSNDAPRLAIDSEPELELEPA